MVRRRIANNRPGGRICQSCPRPYCRPVGALWFSRELNINLPRDVFDELLRARRALGGGPPLCPYGGCSLPSRSGSRHDRPGRRGEADGQAASSSSEGLNVERVRALSHNCLIEARPGPTGRDPLLYCSPIFLCHATAEDDTGKAPRIKWTKSRARLRIENAPFPFITPLLSFRKQEILHLTLRGVLKSDKRESGRVRDTAGSRSLGRSRSHRPIRRVRSFSQISLELKAKATMACAIMRPH
jgi:hypothetical protein